MNTVEYVDRPVAWVSQLERGVQPIERLSALQNLADALELPPAALARRAGALSRSSARPPDPQPGASRR